MSMANRRLPPKASRLIEQQVQAAHRATARVEQEKRTGYEGHGMVALDISPLPPLDENATSSQTAATAKLTEDVATAKTMIRHRIRCTTLQPRRAGRPFDWARLLLMLSLIDTPFLQAKQPTTQHAQRAPAKRRYSERARSYKKKEKKLVEQISVALGCSEETAKDGLRQARLVLTGWKIGVPGRLRGKWAPYAASRFKNGKLEKDK